MSRETCKGQTKAGKPCKSPFVDEEGYCPAHAPGGTATMRERGRKGAQTTKARYKGRGLHRDQLGCLESIEDAQRWLRMIAQAVGAREITHNEGAAMTSTVRAWLSAEDSRLRAEDLAELQGQIAELRRKGLRPA